MKKIIYHITIILAVAVCGSCTKFLETIPEDAVTETNFYETEAQLNAALAGVYQVLCQSGTYASGMPGLMGLDADESFYNRSTQVIGIQMNNVTTSESRLSGNWSAWYNGINRANMLIANINKPAMNETARQVIKGEALFLRAYYYFQLVSNYGGVPLRLEPLKGVTDVTKARATAREVYEQVIKDMTEAETMVRNITEIGNAGHVSKSAVRGLLARVCLYMAGEPLKDESKYALAKQWAKKVMDDGFHQLNADYRQVFINHAADQYDIKESIWEVEFYGNASGVFQTSGYIGISNGITHNGTDPALGFRNGYIAVAPRLYFSYNRRDFRRNWNIAPYTLSNTNPAVKTYLPAYPTVTQASERNCAKWRREYEKVLPRDAGGGPTNFPLLRYSDILLMFAEAETAASKAAPTEEAIAAVNEVRRRAYGKFLTEKRLLDTIAITTAGSGYTSAPVISITGGGGAGAQAVATVATSGTRNITAVFVAEQGGGYTTAPTVTVGNVWATGTAYATGTQVSNAGRLYTVTTAGTATATPPTQSSGASSAAVTGAVFTYAGVAAVLTPVIVDLATVDADVPAADAQSATAFINFIKAERSRELAFECFRKRDLVRWGEYVTSMKQMALEFSLQTARQWGGRAGQNTSDRDVIWPIPDSETTVNAAIVQNLGW